MRPVRPCSFFGPSRFSEQERSAMSEASFAAPGVRNHWWDWLKIVAAWAMLCDHLRFVWPDLAGLFWIGRVAFPVFGVIAAANFSASRNPEKYILKLAGFGAVSEIPFQLLTGTSGNILLLFALSFAVVYFDGKGLPWSFLVFPAFLAACLCVYGFWGAYPLMVWTHFRQTPALVFCGALMNPFPFSLVSGVAALLPSVRSPRIGAAPSLVPDWLWWFYPVHLAVLVLTRFIASLT